MLSNLSTVRLKPISLSILLAVLAYLGNVASLPLFYGIDFIFGSIAVMYAAMTLPRLSVLVVVLVGSLYTLQLWGHPYALIIFTLEAIWLSQFWRRGLKRVVVVDTAFWIILGIPLAFLFIRNLLG